MRGIRYKDLMVLYTLPYLSKKPVQRGDNAKDLCWHRAANIAQVVGGPVLDRVLQIVQGAQADLHAEPDHQGKGCHQTGYQGSSPPRQCGGKGIAIAVPLPNRDDRVAGQVPDGRALRHPQHAYRFAPILSYRVVEPFLVRLAFRYGRIGIAGNVDATGAGDVVEKLAAPGVRDKIPRAGGQCVPARNRHIAGDRQSCGQQAPVEQGFRGALRHFKAPKPQNDGEQQQRRQDQHEKPRAQRHCGHALSTSSI